MSKRRRTYCIGLEDGTLCGERLPGRRGRHRRTSNVLRVTCATCLVQMDRTLEAGLATIQKLDVPVYVMPLGIQRVEPEWEFVSDTMSYTVWRGPAESWTWDPAVWSGRQNATEGP